MHESVQAPLNPAKHALSPRPFRYFIVYDHAVRAIFEELVGFVEVTGGRDNGKRRALAKRALVTPIEGVSPRISRVCSDSTASPTVSDPRTVWNISGTVPGAPS